MTVEEIQETMRLEQQVAAWRTLDILTQWLREHPGWGYTTRFVAGKFELIIRDTRTDTRGWFKGETIQDVYAQAAQTISFNGGSL